MAKPQDGLEFCRAGMTGENENYGAGKVEDFTWKELLDLGACTACGRCQEVCPAFASGKKLNPLQVVQDLKNHVYDTYPSPFRSGRKNRKDMIIDVVTDQAIWDCTTCRACQQACPLFIELVETIIDMRGNLVMDRSQIPESVEVALKCLGIRWHPFRGAVLGRLDWAESLGVKVLSETRGSTVDILYWAGCTTSLQERTMKVAQATARVMQLAGVNFGILGDEEMCCGDPARRLGDEYQYQAICQRNVEILNGYGVKKIVTSCPHCLTSLKHEYPRFGGNFEVIHHSQLIAGLLKEGKLKPGMLDIAGLAYHDGCYLCRFNGIYQAPRRVLRSVMGTRELVELEHFGNNGFCCGGGGGHMWMEEEPDKRLNIRRVEEILGAGVPYVATACPWCLTMLDDAIRAKEAGEKLNVMDISEFLLKALEK